MFEDIAYSEHALDVLARAMALLDAGTPFALASSVTIQGGSARELGSLAVIEPSGKMTGYLSNGCIDRDVAVNGQAAIEVGAKRLVHYGTGSPFPDLVLPCGGMLKVLIDPAPDTVALRAAFAALTARCPARLTFDGEAMPAPLTIEYLPKVRLVLAGRGAILRATAEVAHSAGFEVAVLSPDMSDLDALAAITVDPPQHMTSANTAVEAALDARSGFLTLFHDHDWEPFVIKAALSTNCAFIGALGSMRTQAARLYRLETMGVAARDLQRVTGPIGLVPSLRSAKLIGVSAVAQLSGVFSVNQRDVSPAAPALTDAAL